MAFEYFADPSPPVLLKSVTDPIGPWTNYGPKPPALGVNVSSDNWGAGENCLFMVSGGVQVAAHRDGDAARSGQWPAGEIVFIATH